ncbi:hypothetical protein [Haliangium ochraceum]|uniref:PEGA domain-containing protein n=1 Tax=Haliangium ochraceum (strain DSM 14365 / JCM 11303 / SMP-2) TaxID=502025 RepID=D0LUH9_HALO1|nr:hypothetical protein [Haliangium ochraceum]ACY19302.1 hypothetical protein Hoch_6838 [Haliangium ochraceum DSM 14365]
MCLAALAACLWLLASPAAAYAQADAKVLVIPLESALPPEQTDIVLAFNLAFSNAVEDEAADVTVAQASLDDTLGVIGCTERSPSCLARAARTMGVGRIVFGRVSAGSEPDSYEVVLQVSGRDETPPQRYAFTVRASEVGEAEDAFAEAAPSRLLQPPAEEGGSEGAEPGGSASGEGATGEPGGEAVEAGQGGGAFDFQRIDSTPVIVAGAGAALVGLGATFWLLASSSQSDVNRAAVDSASDLEALRDLEARTESRAQIGNALVLTGAITAGVGVFLAVRQGMSGEPQSVQIAPTATESSLGLMLRWTR